jgi:hypothetical protein
MLGPHCSCTHELEVQNNVLTLRLESQRETQDMPLFLCCLYFGYVGKCMKTLGPSVCQIHLDKGLRIHTW